MIDTARPIAHFLGFTALLRRAGFAVARLRREPLAKHPGIAEAVEWAEAATLLNEQGAHWPAAFRRSLGVVLKDEDDLVHIAPRIDAILAEAQA